MNFKNTAKHIVLSFFCIASILAKGYTHKKLFFEGFENNSYRKLIKTSVNSSSATSKQVSPGQLSKHSLKISKPDTCGHYIFSSELKIPQESQGKWIKVTADIKTGYKGPYAEYYLMVTPVEK